MSDLQEKLETAIRETLKDRDGAGSDLQTVDDGPGDEWLYVEGNLDVQHLASHVIDTLGLDSKVEMEYALEETRISDGTTALNGRWSKWLENVEGSKNLMERSQKWYIEATGAPMFAYRIVQRPKPEAYTYVEEEDRL